MNKEINLTDTADLLELSHTLRSLAALSGTEMGVAIQVVARQSPILEESLIMCRDIAVDKSDLSEGLRAMRGPAFVPFVVRVGEEVGQRSHALLTISNFFDTFILDHSHSHTIYDPKFEKIFDLYMLALLQQSNIGLSERKFEILTKNCSLGNRSTLEQVSKSVLGLETPLSNALEDCGFPFPKEEASSYISLIREAEGKNQVHIGLKQVVNDLASLLSKRFVPFPEVAVATDVTELV